MHTSLPRSVVLTLCALVASTPVAAGQRASRPAKPPAPVAVGPLPTPVHTVAPPDASQVARVVAYNPRDVVSVRARVRYTTLIVLPDGEEILDITCGDKEFWAIQGTQNLAYVKPAREDAQTNMNLVTASGHIYSFVLAEVSNQTGAEPDLKLFLELSDDPAAEPGDAPRFVSARELEHARRQTEEAREQVRRAEGSTQAAIDAGVSRFITNVRFAYRFEAGRKPFYVRAMYHDERFTYIQARPEEVPTLYEIKDGKPNLVSFDYRDGVFVVTKILDSGYLAIGKQRLAFTREE